jgi:hypothetical protein
MTYAVVWSDRGGPSFAGSLELQGGSAVLSGSVAGGEHALHRLLLSELEGVRLERRRNEPPVVVVRVSGGARLEIASLEGGGALYELAEALLGVGTPA